MDILSVTRNTRAANSQICARLQDVLVYRPARLPLRCVVAAVEGARFAQSHSHIEKTVNEPDSPTTLRYVLNAPEGGEPAQRDRSVARVHQVLTQ